MAPRCAADTCKRSSGTLLTCRCRSCCVLGSQTGLPFLVCVCLAHSRKLHTPEKQQYFGIFASEQSTATGSACLISAASCAHRLLSVPRDTFDIMTHNPALQRCWVAHHMLFQLEFPAINLHPVCKALHRVHDSHLLHQLVVGSRQLADIIAYSSAPQAAPTRPRHLQPSDASMKTSESDEDVPLARTRQSGKCVSCTEASARHCFAGGQTNCEQQTGTPTPSAPCIRRLQTGSVTTVGCLPMQLCAVVACSGPLHSARRSQRACGMQAQRRVEA